MAIERPAWFDTTPKKLRGNLIKRCLQKMALAAKVARMYMPTTQSKPSDPANEDWTIDVEKASRSR